MSKLTYVLSLLGPCIGLHQPVSVLIHVPLTPMALYSSILVLVDIFNHAIVKNLPTLTHISPCSWFWFCYEYTFTYLDDSVLKWIVLVHTGPYSCFWCCYDFTSTCIDPYWYMLSDMVYICSFWSISMNAEVFSTVRVYIHPPGSVLMYTHVFNSCMAYSNPSWSILIYAQFLWYYNVCTHLSWSILTFAQLVNPVMAHVKHFWAVLVISV